MPVPSNISDLSTTPADNSPPGTESPSTADDYLRTHAAFIAQLDDADAAHVAAAAAHVAAATDPHAAAGYVKQQQIDSSLAAHQQAADPHVRYVQLSNLTALSLPAGSLIYYAGSVAPAGYLEANGAWISRTTYAALFAAIGIIYNAGDGSTTFGLPDLRGEFIRGWDNGRGLDAGRLVGSWQSGGVPFALYHTSGRVFDGGSAGRSMDAYTNYFGTQSVANAGELRPRNVALLACIKY